MAPILVYIVTVAAPSATAEALVQELGNRSFAVRERSGERLVVLGRPAVAAVRRGRGHADLEVAERSTRLLPAVEREAVRQRVAFLMERPFRRPPDDVPFARRFLEITGDTEAGRKLYVEMYLDHASMLESTWNAGDKAGKEFWAAIDRLVTPEGAEFDDAFVAVRALDKPTQPRLTISMADMAMFLLVSSDPRVPMANSQTANSAEFPYFLTPSQAHFKGPKASPELWKLLSAWMVGPRNFGSSWAEASRLQQAYALAQVCNPAAARPVFLQIALDPKQWHVARGAALIGLARVGNAGDVADLSRVIADNTSMGTSGNREAYLGDVALFACLRLTDQALTGYYEGHREVKDAVDCGFNKSAERSAARQRWAAWAAMNKGTAPGK